MNKEEFKKGLSSAGIELHNNNHSDNMKVYNGYIYMFDRQLQKDFYFLHDNTAYVLRKNEDYLNSSLTETGRFPDSKKIKFDKCEKIAKFNVPFAEEEGSILSEEVSLNEQYYVHKVIGGSQIYYKLIGGLCVSKVTLGAMHSKIEISQYGVQTVDISHAELIPVNKSNYESALINALKIISNENTKS